MKDERKGEKKKGKNINSTACNKGDVSTTLHKEKGEKKNKKKEKGGDNVQNY